MVGTKGHSGIYKHKKGYKVKPFSEEHKRKMSLARKGKTYEQLFGIEKAKEYKKNISLAKSKGKHSLKDKVKYSALHNWLRKHKPKPELCEKCNKRKFLDLANIKNHRYTRRFSDYKWLCKSCHNLMDRRYSLSSVLRNYNLRSNS